MEVDKMHIIIRTIIISSAILLLLTSSLNAAPVQIGKSARTLGPSAALNVFKSGVLLNAGQYDFDINVTGLVWQKGIGSFGWEPDDQFTIQALLDGVPVAEVTQSGLNGQRQVFSKLLALSLLLDRQKRLDINIITDASSPNERLRISEIDAGDLLFQVASNQESLPIPLPGAFYLLGSGLIGLAVWRKRYK
jgi:hypothetical protein